MEMVVNCNIGEQTANVYTKDKSVMQKPNRLVADYLDFYKLRKQTDIDENFLIRGMAEKLLSIVPCSLL